MRLHQSSETPSALVSWLFHSVLNNKQLHMHCKLHFNYPHMRAYVEYRCYVCRTQHTLRFSISDCFQWVCWLIAVSNLFFPVFSGLKHNPLWSGACEWRLSCNSVVTLERLTFFIGFWWSWGSSRNSVEMFKLNFVCRLHSTERHKAKQANQNWMLEKASFNEIISFISNE